MSTSSGTSQLGTSQLGTGHRGTGHRGTGHRGTSQRTLHLVDLENLVGDPRAGAELVLDTFDRYLGVAGWRAGDHVIVALTPGLITKVMFDLSVPSSVHSAPGRDGADEALLAFAAPHHVTRRYGRLVIGSGDGIFAPLAHAVRAAGTEVLVVTRVLGWSQQFLGLTRSYVDLEDQRSAA